MKSLLRRISTAAAVAGTAAATLLLSTPAIASIFGQQEVDQSRFVAIASPIGGGSSHQLLIVEQIATTRQCWEERGSNPTIINPLLLSFDFTGICGRSTDSNGYSIRIAGQDLGVQYSLRVVRRGGDLVLVGVPFNRNAGPEYEIGRANGITTDFAKITLDPGWRFTKRTYEGRTLGHVYLTRDTQPQPTDPPPVVTPPPTTPPTTPPPVVTPPPTTPPTTPSFRDVAGDIYAADIQRAVQRGFISGFAEDNTFRPTASLTREQLVSIVIEALDTIPGIDLAVPTQVSGNPYRDVNASRWSAAKIQFARDNNIVSGYQDGTFRPAQPVTRAELMAVLRRAAEYGRSRRGLSSDLTATTSAFSFADISGHWAESLITQMSTYCGVASPVNETGRNFTPNNPALRNYATAATLRMIQCVED
jgi:N-acetylmuramoyl-L-alanine amidase